ncbi:MAG: hypothetical protein FJZ92_05945 [Chloroflexi bacterium]|nr:hypothetical protein [Chloroflexota bacterium]
MPRGAAAGARHGGSAGICRCEPQWRDAGYGEDDEQPSHREPLVAGLLVARPNGTVVGADASFCALIGASGPAALIGRSWVALVSPSDAARLAGARATEAAGARWEGLLAVRIDRLEHPLLVELASTGAPDPLTVLRVEAPGVGPSGTAAPAGRASDADARAHTDAEALLAAVAAADEAGHAPSAARGVLQAIRAAIAFDFAVVIRYIDGESAVPGAQVLATYPGEMAGVERGARWSPLDLAERAILETGEPSLDGALGRHVTDRSPLARLPTFGMRSRLALPLYAGDRVRGALALFSAEPNAFSPGAGVPLERFARPLRAHLDAGAARPAAPIPA